MSYLDKAALWVVLVSFRSNQTGIGEDLSDLLDGRRVSVGGQQLLKEGPALRVFRAFTGLRQAQEDPATRFLLVCFEPCKDLVGTPFQSPLQPANLLVGSQGQPAALAPLPQFRQGVLQERQGARLVLDIPDQGLDQPRFQLVANTLSRTFDSPPKLILREIADEYLMVGQGARQGFSGTSPFK